MSKGFACACTTCFRTCISLDTTRFYTEQVRSVTTLNQLKERLTKAFPQLLVALPMQSASSSKSLYESLEDASEEHYSNPLFLLQNITLKSEVHEKIHDALVTSGQDHFLISSNIELHIYDNTIALMEWSLESQSNDSGLPSNFSPRDFDRVTSSISKILISEMTDTYINVLLSEIRNINDTTRRKWRGIDKPIFRHPEKLNLFSDLKQMSQSGDRHMWTSRTAVLQDLKSLESNNSNGITWYKLWAEGDGEHISLPEHDCDCRIGWGNSALAGPGCPNYLGRFLSIKRRIQYFYAITIIHNKNLSGLFMQGSSTSGKSLIEAFKKHKLVQTNLYYLESLMFDTENGLQGGAFLVYQAFLNQWRFRKLLSGSQRKAEIANSLLEGKIAEKRFAIQKHLRSLLVALSIIEVLGVIIELVHMANSDEIRAGDTWGVLAIIHSYTPDTIITSMMLPLVFLIILIIASGIQSEK